jgi:Dr1-associated corepressor
MGRKQHPLAARIKKMMQADEDVGRIAQASPTLISTLLSCFA